MTGKHFTLLPAAALLTAGMACTAANAAPIIEESFDYAVGSVSGANGGTGFTGAWSTVITAPPVVSPGLTWGSLPVAGNSVNIGGNNGGASRDIGGTSVLDNAGLMANGATLWFSVIMDLPPGSFTNADFNFALGTDGFANYGGGEFGERRNLQAGEGIGMTIHNRSATLVDVHAAYWQNNDADAYADRNYIYQGDSEAINRWPGPTGLFVGKIEWGADDLAAETITLYAPDAALNLGSALVSWETPALDQSAFDTVAFQLKGSGGIDEIRFGATSGDVLVPEPGSLALLGLGGLAVARRRRS